MYYTSIEDAKNNIKEKKESKPRKKKQSELFDMRSGSDKKPKQYKNISTSEMNKLKDHSKNHKARMNSKHMKDMIKYMKEGDSFSKAHKKAMKN